jgi:2-desacetyl-2-hydroxyethyl bacteriochlorophyllide A dehydrogenase
MKVPFVHGPGDLRLDEVAPPRAGARDVVVRVATVGICGSDLGYVAMGGIAGPGPHPIPLGHELSGTVAACGGEVTDFAPGDRVIVNPLFNGIGNGGPEGGFADLLLVRDVVAQPKSLWHLPDHLSFDQGALVEPLAVAQHAVNRAAAHAGETVALFGAGPIGLGIVVALRRRGVSDIVVFDLSPHRRASALQLGARLAVNPCEVTMREVLGDAHGSSALWGMDVVNTNVFIEASGAASVIPDIVACAGFQARLLVVSIQKKPVAVDFQTVLGKEMTISAAMGYPDEFPDVIAMLASGDVDVSPMVSHHFDGADFVAAFDTAKRAESAAKVLVRYAR